MVIIPTLLKLDKQTGLISSMRTCCLLTLLLYFSIHAAAEELITDFHSDILVNEHGQIKVIEQIEVNAENININRGIFRDFPTQYMGAYLTKKQVGFEVVSVFRDGQIEPFHTEQLSNGIRVYIGSSNVHLNPGKHRYKLTYKTDKQLGYFKTFDEFYWNVTGTGWSFPIEHVSATVTLPSGAINQVLEQSAWTGYQGEKGQAYITANTADTLVFKTTQRLHANQGLTIGIQVPKGFFIAPAPDLGAFIMANGLWLLNVVVGLFYLAFYFSAWYRFGRDPEPGVIMARFSAPNNLSPAAVHYIDNQGSNDKTLTTALLSMATKGFLTITQLKKQYQLILKKSKPTSSLSTGELAIKRELFGGHTKKIMISKQYNSKIKRAKNKLNRCLKDEFHNSCFIANRFYVLWGWFIGVVCFFLGTLLIYSQTLSATELLISLVAFCFMLGMASIFFFVTPIFISILVLIILASNHLALFHFLLDHKTWLFFIATILVLSFTFTYLLRSFTPFGRHIKDQIEGLKLYMKAAEEHRLNMLNPPDRTVEHYEQLLPYAVALNLEQQWAEQFTTTLKTQDSQPKSKISEFQPSWYQNQTSNTGEFNFTINKISQSLKHVVAASSVTPSAVRSSSSSSYSSSTSSSSSGSSGGSSGGGGGGGGGGGW